jgi:hypothetical protein
MIEKFNIRATWFGYTQTRQKNTYTSVVSWPLKSPAAGCSEITKRQTLNEPLCDCEHNHSDAPGALCDIIHGHIWKKTWGQHTYQIWSHSDAYLFFLVVTHALFWSNVWWPSWTFFSIAMYYTSRVMRVIHRVPRLVHDKLMTHSRQKIAAGGSASILSATRSRLVRDSFTTDFYSRLVRDKIKHVWFCRELVETNQTLLATYFFGGSLPHDSFMTAIVNVSSRTSRKLVGNPVDHPHYSSNLNIIGSFNPGLNIPTIHHLAFDKPVELQWWTCVDEVVEYDWETNPGSFDPGLNVNTLTMELHVSPKNNPSVFTEVASLLERSTSTLFSTHWTTMFTTPPEKIAGSQK